MKASAPFLSHNQNDHRALVMVTTVVLCLLMLTALIGKHIVRLKRGSSLHHFDYILLCGVLFMLFQTACIILAVDRGLGKHLVDASEASSVSKLLYSASLLGTASLACTKTSTCLLIRQINDYGRLHVATRLILGIILATSFSGIIATAFRCALPSPWQAMSPSACPGAIPVYFFNGVANITTDTLLCALSVAMVWNIKSDVKKKATVIFLFTSRVICPMATIPSLMQTKFLYENSDFTWLAVSPTVWLQISYNLAVITACIPTMKNVFDSMSGNLSAEIDAPYKLTAVTGARSIGFEASALDQEPSQTGSHFDSQGTGLKLHTAAPNQAACYATDGRKYSPNRARRDDESQSESVQNLTDGVVLVTEEVNVQFEDDRPPSPVGTYHSWYSTQRHITGSFS